MKKQLYLWLLFAAFLLPVTGRAQTPSTGVILIGDTSNMVVGSTHLPYESSTSSYTQQLVLRSELNGEAIITGIDLYCANPSTAGRGGCTIYLANTYVSRLDSMVHFGALFQAVAYNSLACTVGWNHYDFDSAFHYNGFGNLIVAFDCPWGIGSYGGGDFYCEQTQNSSRYDHTQLQYLSYSHTYGTPYRNVMRLHTQPVPPAVANCPPPTLWVDSLGADAVKLKWSPGYQDTSWTVECITDGDTAWRSSGLVWGDTSYTMTGLSPNTHYTFRLTAFCTSSSTTVLKHVLTNCTHAPLPYAENLESSWSMPSCWYTTPGTDGDSPIVSSRFSHSSSRSVRLQGGAVVLPAFNAPPDSLELYFWARSNGGSNRNLYIGMVTDPLDMSTFVPLDTLFVTNYSHWFSAAVRTDRYSRPSGRLAIITADPLNTWMFIDDIEVSRLVPCEALASATLDWKTDTAALVRWTDTVGAVYYDVAYGPRGFVPDSTTIVTNVRTDSLRLTGLTPYTQYDVYVRPECGSYTTHWSPVMTFRTLCSLLDTLPLVEDFDSYPIGTNPTSIPCWQGRVGMNTTILSLSADAHSGSNVMRFEWSIYEDVVDQKLVLPAINSTLLPLNTLQLSFWAKNIENTYNRYDLARVVVGVMDNPDVDSTFQAIDTVNITGEEWFRYDVPLTAYSGSGKYIAVLSCPGIGENDNWLAYFDDVSINFAAPCANITGLSLTGLTATSVSLQWDAADSGTVWHTFIDTSSNASPVAGSVPLTSPSCTLDGLTAGTPYYVWVRAICPKGDTSGWEGPMQVMPGTWNMRPNKHDTLSMCGVSLFDNGGPAGDFSYQHSQLVILPDMPGHLVSLSGFSHCGGGSELTIYDGVGTSGAMLWTSGLNNNYTINIDPILSSSGALTITFDGWAAFYTYEGFALQVSCVPDTCIIHNLQLDTSALSDSSLSLTWQCNGASLYQVEYGPAGFTPGSGTIDSTTSNHYSIPALHSLDRLEVHVRSICGLGDTGQWVSGFFSTQLCSDAVYRENFDSTLYQNSTPSMPIGFNGMPYSYVQTLIDSAHLAGLEGGITALAFRPADIIAADHHNNISVFLANVPDTAFFSGPIMPDAGHRFVKVIDSANFCHNATTDWLLFSFDRPFMWDGHQNLLVAVLRQDGGSGLRTEYASHYRYSDYRDDIHRSYVITSDVPISLDSTIPGGYGTYYMGDMRLYTNTCHLPLCAPPSIDSVVTHYESATIHWSGSGSDYQLTLSPGYPSPVSVSGNSYTFTGLLPATTYQLSLRQNCTADSLGFSDWASVSIVTDSFFCPPPDSAQVYDITHNSATFNWSASGNDSLWRIEVWQPGDRHMAYTVNQHPYTIEELASGSEYLAYVHGYCGSNNQIDGLWSDTLRFSTLACPAVTGLDTSALTPTSVALVWNAEPLAQDYIVEYGPAGYTPGSGSELYVSTNSCTIPGLSPATAYDFHVRTRCADDWLALEVASLLNVVTPQPAGIDSPESSETKFSATLVPNPAKDVTSLILEGLPSRYKGAIDITVSDLTGREVLVRSINCNGGCSLSLDLNNLSQGAYFVRIACNGLSVVRKLIVK